MIIYLVKSTLLLGLLYGLYKLLLENEKIHRFNRFFLLFALIFGLTAPLISFELNPESSIAGIKMQQMERMVNAPAEAVSNSVEPLIAPEKEAIPKSEIAPVSTEKPGWSISALDVLLGMYGLITLFLLIRFAGGLLEIRNKIKAGSHEKAGPATLVLLDDPITPQSFFQFIFLGKESFENGEIEPEILDHELTHVRQLHSLDVLFIEFLKVLFWFNPFIYLFKHAIQLNHEFLADESVVGRGSSISDYQSMLIRVSAGNRHMSTTSSISYSLTKKRLKMMIKKFSALRSGSKGFLLAPLLLTTMLMFCTQSSNRYPIKITTNTEEAFTTVDLYINPIRSDELGIEKRALGIRYDSTGKPFTGIQKWIHRPTQKVVNESFYEGGIMKSSEAFSLDGKSRGKYEYGFIGEEYKVIKKYTAEGMLIEEWENALSSGNTGHHKQWYKDGQLKYEAYFTGNIQYQGLMTLYDKQGNILEQERYEDGELIEKIK